jgi:predicted RNA polymerase sigma factor
MTPGQMEHSIKMLIGEVHALSMVCQTLVMTHPQRDALLAEIEQGAQQGLANIENLPVPDDTMIEGYQFVMAAVRKALLSRGGGRG